MRRLVAVFFMPRNKTCYQKIVHTREGYGEENKK